MGPRLNQGEPYAGAADPNPAPGDDLPLVVLHRPLAAPAPLLIANGWTDDLFPVDEALRFYNRTRPSTRGRRSRCSSSTSGTPGRRTRPPTGALRHGDPPLARLYLKGRARKPFQGVEALTETCPASAPSAGPLARLDWARLAPGEVRRRARPPRRSCRTPAVRRSARRSTRSAPRRLRDGPGAIQPGTATPSCRAGAGFTLVGAPTVVADITLPGAGSQVAARLLDVGPDGRRPWSPEGSGGRGSRPRRCGRSSSSTRGPGASRRATPSSSSCCPTTRRTAGPPTTSSP